MPSLLRLIEINDPQIRSKSVLMIGRASKNVSWVRAKLGDDDPRIRASAVESLWGCEGLEVRDLLRSAAHDPHHRVVANALCGLYGMGETAAIPELMKMASSQHAMFRTAAAWAMGETGDRRFADMLGKLMCDSNPGARKRAFVSLGRVRSAVAQTRSGNEWRIAGSAAHVIGSARRLVVEVGPYDNSPLPKLVATNFILSDGEGVIYDYQIEEKPAPETLSLSFIFPRSSSPDAPWVLGALNSLFRKRENDLWRTLYYVEAEDGARGGRVELPPYNAVSKSLKISLQKRPSRTECRNFWNTLRESVRTPTQGARRFIVYCPQDLAVPGDSQSIISAAVAEQVEVQVVAHAQNAILEDLCRRSRGSFHLVPPGADITRVIEDAYLTLRARFSVRYQANSASDSLHIWVSNATGWGETMLNSGPGCSELQAVA